MVFQTDEKKFKSLSERILPCKCKKSSKNTADLFVRNRISRKYYLFKVSVIFQEIIFYFILLAKIIKPKLQCINKMIILNNTLSNGENSIDRKRNDRQNCSNALRGICPNMEFFLVRIFPHSD